MLEQREVTNDLDLLLEALPPHIQQAITHTEENPADLLEIILDLGRRPEARYRHSEQFLSEMEITRQDIDYVVSRIGAFGEDNRAGIPRTLHRISAIRNRSEIVIGLTCRVGRAVFGTVTIIQDIIESGKSILLLGKPGTGKTTLLRETARVLSEDLHKRVVVVDTSNEIAGDGDIPHSGIGRARRMQVIRPSAQHGVMIEAVENHMPEVIVIDEIGTELEALAARTIAERGVQLVGTAHGNTLDNLLVNPTLSDLIGGIQAVTLGDDEARRRGTQKTVLERKAPPTFDVLVEIQGWDQVAVYDDVAEAVDGLLRGEELTPTLRRRGEDGQVEIVETAPPKPRTETDLLRRGLSKGTGRVFPARDNGSRHWQQERGQNRGQEQEYQNGAMTTSAPPFFQRIFPFGVNRNRLEDAIEHLHVPAVIVRDIGEATLVMTIKNYYRRSPQPLQQAEAQGVPVYVLRSNTVSQMERQLANIFQVEQDNGDYDDYGMYPDPADLTFPADTQSLEEVMLETEVAISQLINGERDVVEMAPQNSYIRRLQHQMADRYNLRSKSRGSEPHRRVRIYT
jgi:stage III sporulation protein SpoIIIAA